MRLKRNRWGMPPKKFLDVLKLRAEQVFIKEESRKEEWKRLLE